MTPLPLAGGAAGPENANRALCLALDLPPTLGAPAALLRGVFLPRENGIGNDGIAATAGAKVLHKRQYTVGRQASQGPGGIVTKRSYNLYTQTPCIQWPVGLQ